MASLHSRAASAENYPAVVELPQTTLRNRGRPALAVWIVATVVFFGGNWALGTIVESANGRLIVNLAFTATYALVAIVLATRIFRDIDSAHSQLLKSEERFRALLENGTDAIALVDASGTILYAAPSTSRILGYDGGELVGRSAFDLLSAEDRQGAIAGLAYLVQHGGNTPVLEFTLRHKDGTWRWMEGVAGNLLNVPAVQAVVVNYREITERKTAEEALSQSEQQLRQSQKMEAVGQLAGGVAHDFNNLLTIIRGYTELMMESLSREDPLRWSAEQIQRATDQAASLTRQLLAFSRRQVLRPKVLDLNSVVSDMDNMLRRLIGEDIALNAVLDPHLERVKADPGQIEQVIMNLAVNARDAMPQGGSLTVETANMILDETYVKRHLGLLPGQYVMLAVTDTGVGMDPETASHVFEPFFTTKEQGKGTGLGLSTVYGIVKQSDGYVYLDTIPGRGTTFRVFLPQVDEIPLPAEATPVRLERLKGTETILLVEDEAGVRELARAFLLRRGYQILEASSGQQALEMAASYRGAVNLLVTDVVMPGMSGRELAQRLTAARPEVSVLYMSGYTDAAIVRHGILEEGIAFIGKPFTGQALAAKVREVLDLARTGMTI